MGGKRKEDPRALPSRGFEKMNVELALAVGGALFSVGMSWGMIQHSLARQDFVNRETNEKVEQLFNRINQTRETYVSIERFNEAIQGIRESQKELRADLKEALQLLRAHVGE